MATWGGARGAEEGVGVVDEFPLVLGTTVPVDPRVMFHPPRQWYVVLVFRHVLAAPQADGGAPTKIWAQPVGNGLGSMGRLAFLNAWKLAPRVSSPTELAGV